MYALVLGGCCYNVYVLEFLVRKNPDIGTLLTFLQFFSISILSIRHFNLTRQWVVPGLLYGLVNYLNNAVWAYHVSVPMHTIVRSSGVVISMLIGSLKGKHYSKRQVMALVIIGVGIAISLPKDQSPSSSTGFGLGMLAFATVLASIQSWMSIGVAQSWQESLCMCHILCVPFFLLVKDDLIAQAQTLDAQSWRWVALNCFSQYICAVGVNMLAQSRGPVALQVTLTVRKFASLLLSALYFGEVETNVLLAGLIVGAGALLYTFG